MSEHKERGGIIINGRRIKVPPGARIILTPEVGEQAEYVEIMGEVRKDRHNPTPYKTKK